MARGRMINKKISNSRAVDALPEQAQLLYTWLIPHLDCNGCFYGSAQMIKSLVFPRKNYSKTRIENWLKLMEKTHGTEKSPLIVRYFVDGEQYLFMPGFVGEQIGLRRDKEKPEFPTKDGNNTELVGQTVPLRGREGEVEGKGNKERKKESVVLPEWIDKKTWDAFLEMRRDKKSSPTLRAQELIVKELEKFKAAGDDPNEVLNQSIMNGWKGVFKLKAANSGVNRGRELPGNNPSQEKFDNQKYGNMVQR